MNKPSFLSVGLAVVALFALVGAGCTTAEDTAETDTSSTNETTTESTSPTTTTEPTTDNDFITLEEVQQHATADDCWTIIDGMVYDLTDFVGRHPGGEAILQGCGKDGSAMFESNHSRSVREQLPQFEVGILE